MLYRPSYSDGEWLDMCGLVPYDRQIGRFIACHLHLSICVRYTDWLTLESIGFILRAAGKPMQVCGFWSPCPNSRRGAAGGRIVTDWLGKTNSHFAVKIQPPHWTSTSCPVRPTNLMHLCQKTSLAKDLQKAEPNFQGCGDEMYKKMDKICLLTSPSTLHFSCYLCEVN